MTDETNTPNPEKPLKKVIYRNGGPVRTPGVNDAIYGIGLVGALVYYLQHAPTFMMVLLGIIKSLAWPALVVYQLLAFLKM